MQVVSCWNLSGISLLTRPLFVTCSVSCSMCNLVMYAVMSYFFHLLTVVLVNKPKYVRVSSLVDM